MESEPPTIELVGCECSRDYSKKSHTYATYKVKHSKYKIILVCKRCGKYKHFPKLSYFIKNIDEHEQVIWSQNQIKIFLEEIQNGI